MQFFIHFLHRIFHTRFSCGGGTFHIIHRFIHIGYVNCLEEKYSQSGFHNICQG